MTIKNSYIRIKIYFNFFQIKHTAYSLQELLEEISDDLEIGAVYVDGDAGTNFLKISKVISILKRPDVKLFYGATDKFMPISSDNFILGKIDKQFNIFKIFILIMWYFAD